MGEEENGLDMSHLATSFIDVGVITTGGLIVAVELGLGNGVENGVVGAGVAGNFAAHHHHRSDGRAVDAHLHFGGGLRVQLQRIGRVLSGVALGSLFLDRFDHRWQVL
jgi:hypothetical protein